MADTRAGEPPLDPLEDIGLLCQVVATGSSARVLRDLRAAGFADVRVSQGYIFQGLLAGDTTITQLAQRLGVTVQAVSKAVNELVDAGYLERRRDEHDGRARALVMTDRAVTMLAASRRARVAAADEIAARLGERKRRELLRLLRSVSELYGGIDAIAGRRVRPVEDLDDPPADAQPGLTI
jgi:DNA-binding MarR family transcriptional regulator